MPVISAQSQEFFNGLSPLSSLEFGLLLQVLQSFEDMTPILKVTCLSPSAVHPKQSRAKRWKTRLKPQKVNLWVLLGLDRSPLQKIGRTF